MLVLEWKERAFIDVFSPDVFVYFRQPHWCTKTVHQYGVSIQISTKVRETFRKITQKLWSTKTWDFYNISFSWLLPLDGFQFNFVAWQWKRSIRSSRRYWKKRKRSVKQNCFSDPWNVPDHRLDLLNRFNHKWSRFRLFCFRLDQTEPNESTE